MKTQLKAPGESKFLVVFDCDGTLIDTSTRKTYEGIPTMLRELVERGGCLAVWTGRERHSSFKLFKELAIMPYFWEFYCGDDIYPKPQAGPIVEFATAFSRKIMVGDGVVDQQAAKLIAAEFVWAGWNPNVRQSRAAGEYYCRRPCDIFNILDED